MFNFLKKKKQGELEEVLDHDEQDVTQDEKSEEEAPLERDSSLVDLLSESVVEASVDVMKTCSKFVLRQEEDVKYIGLLLDVMKIGGFGKKERNNEAKGQIIELLTSGLLNSYVSADMLENGEIIFIPDNDTLTQMDEFSILKDNVTYELVYVDDLGVVEKSGKLVEFKDVFDYATSDEIIEEWLGSEVEQKEEILNQEEEEKYDEDQPFGEVILGQEEVQTPDDDFGEEEPEYLDGEEEDEEPEYDDEDELEDDEDEGDVQDYIPAVKEESAEESIAQPVDYRKEVKEAVSDEEFKRALIRKFYSDDLNLQVDLGIFEAKFMSMDNVLIQFDENRGEGWLNSYLNQLSKEANLDLRTMHIDHLVKLRDRYFNLITMHCERITSKMDVNKPGSTFSSIKTTIDTTRSTNLGLMDKEIALKREKAMQEWNEELEDVGRRAAIEAKSKHQERYGTKQTDKLNRIDLNVKQTIEDEYEFAMRNLHASRRSEASKLLDLGITETLGVLSEEYVKMLEEERKLYEYYRERIAKYLDEHRKDDVAMRETLAEELRQKEKADKVLDEQTQKFNQQAAEFAAQRELLKAEVDRIERSAKERVEEAQRKSEEAIAFANQRMEIMQKDLENMGSKYQQLDDQKRREYETRLSELASERESWENKCNHIVAVNKKASISQSSLLVAVAVAFLAVGIILGTYMNSAYSSGAGAPPQQQIERSEPQSNGSSLFDNSAEAVDVNTSQGGFNGIIFYNK